PFIRMQSAVLLLALVAAVSATAILRHPLKETGHMEVVEHLTKEVKQQHKLPKGWYVPFYYDTFVNTGKADVLDGMFCKICENIVDDLENLGEETAMDYLEPLIVDLCSGLPFANLQKDCVNFFNGISQDLIDLLNNNAGGEPACELMTLC
ncbi:hypothetical protein PENTCL1PPCAC_621, partial [Pristionchus entomophagus]